MQDPLREMARRKGGGVGAELQEPLKLLWEKVKKRLQSGM